MDKTEQYKRRLALHKKYRETKKDDTNMPKKEKEKIGWVKKLKRNVKEMIGGKNTYISDKQKARIKKDSAKSRDETTGSTQTKKMMHGLSQSDYDEIQKKFGKKTLKGKK